jgi:hypothetical protein
MQILSFDTEYDYSAVEAIELPVILRHGTDEVLSDAYLDTGSSSCIFKRGHAEMLGLNVESGHAVRFETSTGSFDAYGHMLTLETLGYSIDAMVYFAAHEYFRRNVLGRRGWLDRVRLGLVEYESKLYLSRYSA